MTQAAALIHDIDPSLAKLLVSSPFNRHNIVTALHASLAKSSTYSHMADRIAVILRASIDLDQSMIEA